jgi:hypothetical protein
MAAKIHPLGPPTVGTKLSSISELEEFDRLPIDATECLFRCLNSDKESPVHRVYRTIQRPLRRLPQPHKPLPPVFPDIKILDLSNANLRNISVILFTNVPNIKTIDLTGNPNLTLSKEIIAKIEKRNIRIIGFKVIGRKEPLAKASTFENFLQSISRTFSRCFQKSPPIHPE